MNHITPNLRTADTVHHYTYFIHKLLGYELLGYELLGYEAVGRGAIGHATIGAVRESGTGYRLPAADAYARRIAEEAEAWLRHARERSRMEDDTLVRKALSAVAFTLRHRAHDLAVPTKLSSTSQHQPALWRLVRVGVSLGAALDVEEVRDGRRTRLLVSHEGETLGEVQRKHVGWLAPLVPFGAGLHLVRVTGQESDYTLGLNVAVGRAGRAVEALRHALGQDHSGDGYGGDRAAVAPAQSGGEDRRQRPAPGGDDARGDGAAGPLRLVSSAPLVAKPQADTPKGPDDVVLHRALDGTARATRRGRPLAHVVRHSPSGLEWGYHGSGPADLARSVLLAFTDEATAERLYVRFKDVIAAVPRAGTVLRAKDVQAWVDAHRADQC